MGIFNIEELRLPVVQANCYNAEFGHKLIYKSILY